MTIQSLAKRPVLAEFPDAEILAIPATAKWMNNQLLVRFPNGYGASIVSGPHSYSGTNTYELAVTSYKNSDSHIRESRLCMSTPITDDVLGWQTPAEVDSALRQIAALSPRPVLADGDR